MLNYDKHMVKGGSTLDSGASSHVGAPPEPIAPSLPLRKFKQVKQTIGDFTGFANRISKLMSF